MLKKKSNKESFRNVISEKKMATNDFISLFLFGFVGDDYKSPHVVITDANKYHLVKSYNIHNHITPNHILQISTDQLCYFIRKRFSL